MTSRRRAGSSSTGSSSFPPSRTSATSWPPRTASSRSPSRTRPGSCAWASPTATTASRPWASRGWTPLTTPASSWTGANNPRLGGLSWYYDWSHPRRARIRDAPRPRETRNFPWGGKRPWLGIGRNKVPDALLEVVLDRLVRRDVLDKDDRAHDVVLAPAQRRCGGKDRFG